jgi:Repeat of unknown function (DUF5907)
MAWYYTEPRPQRRPLDTPVRPAGGATGGPPTGPAGGDLTGSYPNPDVAAGAVGTPELATGAVTNAKVTDVAYAKITGAPTIPTTLPPSGPASGDLTGTYPNPTLAANAVGTADIGNLQVTDAKINDVAWGKVTGAPTTFPPSGPAGGDLTGTYPNPTVGAAKITRAKTAADLWLAPVPVAGDVGKLLTVTTGPTLAWQTGGGGPPTGPAGGSLAGTYPNPTLTTTGVTAGTYGTAREVAQVTLNAEGRVTAVVVVKIIGQWK